MMSELQLLSKIAVQLSVGVTDQAHAVKRALGLVRQLLRCRHISLVMVAPERWDSPSKSFPGSPHLRVAAAAGDRGVPCRPAPADGGGGGPEQQ
jgi:hypothetical protein